MTQQKLKLTFNRTQFLHSFVVSGTPVGNVPGFVGSAVVPGYDTEGQEYRIFATINSVDDTPTEPVLFNTVTFTVVKKSNPRRNLFTGTFNTSVYRSNYDNVPNVYISDNCSKFIVPANSDFRTLILNFHSS